MSNIIWESKIDDLHQCTVDRINATTGRLVMTNVETNAVVLDQQVSLSVGNEGVSLTDITAWYNLAKASI